MSENNLQLEIAQMERDLASKREALENQKNAGEINKIPNEKETLREIVGEKIQLAQPPSSPPQQPTNNSGQLPPLSVIEPPAYASEALKNKIQELINTAFGESINKAIKNARATGNAALVDAFHDTLVDELYDHLIERRKLQKM